MLRLSIADQDRYKDWAAARCRMGDAKFHEQAYAVACLDDDREIRAVAVFYETYDGHYDVHFASDGSRRWATKNILRGMYAFGFVTLQADVLWTTTGASDIPCLVADIKCGWQIEGRVRQTMPDGSDGILMSMRVGDCVYFQEVANG